MLSFHLVFNSLVPNKYTTFSLFWKVDDGGAGIASCMGHFSVATPTPEASDWMADLGEALKPLPNSGIWSKEIVSSK